MPNLRNLMKHIPLVLLVLIPLIVTSQNIEPKKTSHATINIAGGDAVGDGGSMAYSLGQVFYVQIGDSEHSITEGVQQPIVIKPEIFPNKTREINLMAYPNPMTDHIIVAIKDYEDEELICQLFDMNGRILQTNKIENSKTKIRPLNLPSAVYLLKVTNRGGETVKTFKIIKR